MDIYEAGGGIHFTVNHTRQATEDELYSLLKQRLMRMLANGILILLFTLFKFESFHLNSLRF